MAALWTAIGGTGTEPSAQHQKKSVAQNGLCSPVTMRWILSPPAPRRVSTLPQRLPLGSMPISSPASSRCGGGSKWPSARWQPGSSPLAPAASYISWIFLNMVAFCCGFLAIARVCERRHGLTSLQTSPPPCRSLAAASQPGPSLAAASSFCTLPGGSFSAIDTAARRQKSSCSRRLLPAPCSACNEQSSSSIASSSVVKMVGRPPVGKLIAAATRRQSALLASLSTSLATFAAASSRLWCSNRRVRETPYREMIASTLTPSVALKWY